MNKYKPNKLLEDMYALLYNTEREMALVGLLHPYISTPSTVTHIFNHLTPTPELSPTPSNVTPRPSHPHHHTLTILPYPSLYTVPDGGII